MAANAKYDIFPSFGEFAALTVADFLPERDQTRFPMGDLALVENRDGWRLPWCRGAPPAAWRRGDRNPHEPLSRAERELCPKTGDEID